ncbi:PREDICTED: rRNA methyltransferase 2, mitochondrial-like isoform X2 [Amphimedon queenslandica]|uniref:rRNA methyltransferase 2, mitochondrial n=1 Tax=Amphimedon queenslandica TaxID=400682 RepID=A0AAN0IWF5_AMPQE|nr:PREDICTED: rRNA methyltransferase 2, mitochondrial-like isoform X2 [Amphimedon queenslandica]|eukprot:XP_019849120.1 PREDICTED: rRNA methyltransferase 2, mitochondrial-like isoform X2 [Amphimedon queenslandica]
MVKGKSSSSSRWLQRQFKDPLVKQSKLDDYRARSAYKLIEIDNKYNFLKRKSAIVDLGACPGAWSQVASQRIGTSQLSNDELVTWNHGMVLAVDKEVMRGLPGVFVIDRADITSSETLKRIYSFLSQRKVDAVISDMAPNATGMHKLDHERIMELANTAFQVAQNCLKTNGTFLCKIFQGSLLNGFKHELKTSFESVQEIRCQSTRKESTEMYLLAQQYKED